MSNDTTNTSAAHDIERLHIIATVWTAALALRHISRGVSEETTSDPETWAVAQMLDTLVMQMQDADSAAKAAQPKAKPSTTNREVMPTAPIDTGIFDLENDRDDLVKAMGQLTAARHDIMGAFSEGNALDEVFRLLASVKAGLENAHGALVDAGVYAETKGGA